MEENIRDRLIENIKDNWEYIDIYYTPTEKEVKAIADAYWNTIIKDWFEKSQFKLSAANDSSYEFEMDFQWSAPDMDSPTMIKEMPRFKKTEEKATLHFDRADIDSEIPTVDIDNFRKTTDPLKDLIV